MGGGARLRRGRRGGEIKEEEGRGLEGGKEERNERRETEREAMRLEKGVRYEKKGERNNCNLLFRDLS